MVSMRMILMSFGVSSELLNDAGNKTYSNYREARKALYMEASIPMARKIYGAITKQLSKYYDDSPVIRLDVDRIESIQEDRGFAAERLTRMVDAGIITPNEAREELGYSRKDGGDELGRYLSTPRTEQVEPTGDNNEQL
jgi:phage portal protein BeeE